MSLLSFMYRQIFVHPPPLPSDLNLSGQTILITGSNSGIGLATARECARLNCAVLILAVRTTSKGDFAKRSIQESYPSSTTKIEVWELEMESFASVQAFGTRLKELESLHVAILNAGAFPPKWTVVKETGYETSLMVNHLATAMLMLYVLPVLTRTSELERKATKMTISTSEVYMWTPFKQQKAERIVDATNDEKLWGDQLDHYSVTKLLNLLWDLEFVSRIGRDDVVVNMVNPGSVVSGLHRDAAIGYRAFDKIIGRTVEEAARLVLDAAVIKGSETHGKYLSEAKAVPISKFVQSKEGQQIQKRLWKETTDILENYMPSSDFNKMKQFLE